MNPSILPFTVASSGTSAYLAVHGCQEGGYLSPRVMQWDEHILLIDLTPTISYWRQQATERGMSLEEFLASVLPVDSFSVLTTHPWQAVLHLKTLLERKHSTLVNLTSAFGKALSRDVSWESWISTSREIALHWQVCGRKTETITRHLRTMEQTMERMQVHLPWQLESMDAAGIRRRFGAGIAQLWEWTFADCEVSAATRNITPESFPWRLIRVKETPQVQRFLEYPLREWDHIEALLREDLDRICNLTCWDSSERVVSLEWVLSFSNSPALPIPVLFRHPHSLHREANQHKTALLQAFYAWQSTLKASLRESRFKPDTQYLQTDAVVEWSLSVRERLIIPAHARSLFMDDLNSPGYRLREIENTLPVDLIRFDTVTDWTPEDSWSNHSSESNADGSDDEPKGLHSQEGCLRSQHQYRPLFIYQSPRVLSTQRSSGFMFKERVMCKWWQSESTADYARNYYLRTNEESGLQWVFQDHNGKFFLHGIYG